MRSFISFIVNFYVTNLSVCRVKARTLFGTSTSNRNVLTRDCFLVEMSKPFLSKPDLTRLGSGSWFACCSRPWGRSIVQSPTGGGPLGLVIYIINTSLFSTFQLYWSITSFLSEIWALTYIHVIFLKVSQES